MEYRYGSHTVYQIEYHFVWVTKYRYKVLRVRLRNGLENWLGRHVNRLKFGLSEVR